MLPFKIITRILQLPVKFDRRGVNVAPIFILLMFVVYQC